MDLRDWELDSQVKVVVIIVAANNKRAIDIFPVVFPNTLLSFPLKFIVCCGSQIAYFIWFMKYMIFLLSISLSSIG